MVPAAAIVPAMAALASQLGPVPERPFARVDGPVLVRVAAPCELVAMDADGRELGRAPAAAGDLDVAAAIPAVRAAPLAVRVQALVGGAPVDAPVVVTPLEVRPTIRTVDDLRPDGRTRFTRIIGWGDRLLDPANPAHAEAAKSWEKADPAPRSGFRVDLDVDVVLETGAGRIRFALRPDMAPATARNFAELAARGFYDGTIVHRVVPRGRGGRPFVIQGGDPTGTGDGGPGYDIMLEPSALPHDFGVVSMARNDWPDSAGSQWFVALTREETARLDGQYCAFGEAVEGADAILAIERGEIADEATGRPRAPVAVTRAFVQPARPWVPGKGRPERRVERPGAAR